MTRRVSILFAIIVVLIASSSCSASDDLVGAYDDSADTAKLDLSSSRADWWPKLDDSYYNHEGSTRPRINGEEQSGLVVGGDQRKFLLLREEGSETGFGRSLEVSAGKKYEAYIFFKNISAKSDSPSTNSELTSRNTRLSFNLPSSVSQSSTTVSAQLFSSNSSPGTVGSSATVQKPSAYESIRLSVSSAAVYSQDQSFIENLPVSDLISGRGATISCGANSSPGDVPPECSGYAIVKFEAASSKFRSKFEVSFTRDTDSWENYLLISGQIGGLWAQLTYVNTGDVEQSNVEISMSLDENSPFEIKDGSPYPYYDLPNTSRQYVYPATLKDGVTAPKVDAGKTYVVGVWLTPKPGWQSEICKQGGKVALAATISSDGFYSNNLTATAYADASLC